MQEVQRNREALTTLTLKRKWPAPHTAPVGQGTAAPWHSLTAEAVLRELNVETQGLTAAEASARLGRSGRNEIARRKPVSPLLLLLKQFANFFVLMLLFAAGLAYAASYLPVKAAGG
jgi:Ca2+-transporting ATPase